MGAEHSALKTASQDYYTKFTQFGNHHSQAYYNKLKQFGVYSHALYSKRFGKGKSKRSKDLNRRVQSDLSDYEEDHDVGRRHSFAVQPDSLHWQGANILHPDTSKGKTIRKEKMNGNESEASNSRGYKGHANMKMDDMITRQHEQKISNPKEKGRAAAILNKGKEKMFQEQKPPKVSFRPSNIVDPGPSRVDGATISDGDEDAIPYKKEQDEPKAYKHVDPGPSRVDGEWVAGGDKCAIPNKVVEEEPNVFRPNKKADPGPSRVDGVGDDSDSDFDYNRQTFNKKHQVPRSRLHHEEHNENRYSRRHHTSATSFNRQHSQHEEEYSDKYGSSFNQDPKHDSGHSSRGLNFDHTGHPSKHKKISGSSSCGGFTYDSTHGHAADKSRCSFHDQQRGPCPQYVDFPCNYDRPCNPTTNRFLHSSNHHPQNLGREEFKGDPRTDKSCNTRDKYGHSSHHHPQQKKGSSGKEFESHHAKDRRRPYSSNHYSSGFPRPQNEDSNSDHTTHKSGPHLQHEGKGKVDAQGDRPEGEEFDYTLSAKPKYIPSYLVQPKVDVHAPYFDHNAHRFEPFPDEIQKYMRPYHAQLEDGIHHTDNTSRPSYYHLKLEDAHQPRQEESSHTSQGRPMRVPRPSFSRQIQPARQRKICVPRPSFSHQSQPAFEPSSRRRSYHQEFHHGPPPAHFYSHERAHQDFHHFSAGIIHSPLRDHSFQVPPAHYNHYGTQGTWMHGHNWAF